jgi:DNA-binding transcriptional regulator YiaG
VLPLARELGVSRKLLHDWRKAWGLHGPAGLNHTRGSKTGPRKLRPLAEPAAKGSTDELAKARVRKAAGLTQHALARLLKKPQSFVARYEGGERRLDVVEFVAIARALNADPLKLMADFVTDGKNKSARPKKPSAKRNS